MPCAPYIDSPIGRQLSYTSATRPTGANRYVGQRIYETDTQRELLYDGVGWIIMSEPVQSYTPALTNLTPGNGTLACTYHRTDGFCYVTIKFTVGSTSAVGTSPTFSLPVALSDGAGIDVSNALLLDLSAGGRYYGHGVASSGTTVSIVAENTSGTYALWDSVAASVPMTWAAGDSLTLTARYQMTTRYS